MERLVDVDTEVIVLIDSHPQEPVEWTTFARELLKELGREFSEQIVTVIGNEYIVDVNAKYNFLITTCESIKARIGKRTIHTHPRGFF